MKFRVYSFRRYAAVVLRIFATNLTEPSLFHDFIDIKILTIVVRNKMSRNSLTVSRLSGKYWSLVDRATESYA